MNNIKIAKKLIKLAKDILSEQIIAYPTDTYENFDEYAKDYQKKYHERPDEKLWDLFDTQEEVDAFIQNKSKSFPHLKQIISEQTIKRLLDNDWFVIISAGRNDKQIKYKTITDQEIKERYNELRKFLQSLNVPYYEVIGKYNGYSQLSYIVDLSDNGANDETTIKSNLKKIRSFCGNELNQDAIIEGCGKQRVYMYTKNKNLSYHQKIRDINPIEKSEKGRSQVFNDYKNRKNNTTWSDEYDFDKETFGDWIK